MSSEFGNFFLDGIDQLGHRQQDHTTDMDR